MTTITDVKDGVELIDLIDRSCGWDKKIHRIEAVQQRLIKQVIGLTEQMGGLLEAVQKVAAMGADDD